MAQLFSLTVASETVNLQDGQGQVAFTASNVSGRAVRGRAVLVAKDPASKAWLTLSGEAEQDFAMSATRQLTVTIKASKGAKPGKYNARLDVVSVQNPDEDYTEGPTVAIVLSEPSVPTKKKFPWWIIIVAAVFLIIVGGVLWYVLSPSKTSSSTKISVPDVTHMSVADAKQKLTQAKLKEAEKKTTGTPAGQVVSQDPASGTSVEAGTTVTLTVAEPSRVKPKPVESK